MSYVDEFIGDVVGVVEATRLEIAYLRHLHGNHLNWVEDLSGLLIHVGSVQDKPVSISLRKIKIDGNQYLFIEATSKLVDWDQIEAWLKTKMPQKAFVNGKLNKVYAENFVNVLKLDETQPHLPLS